MEAEFQTSHPYIAPSRGTRREYWLSFYMYLIERNTVPEPLVEFCLKAITKNLKVLVT